MSDAGYIKLFRCITSWEWYHDSHMVHLLIHLIMSANHKPGRWKGVELLRGQLITGRHSLSEQTGITERSCRTCLERLKTTKEITIRTTNSYSLITVLNYDSYQDSDVQDDQGNGQENDQQLTNDRPAGDQRATTNKNDKNAKNGRRKEERVKAPKWVADFSSGAVFRNPGFSTGFCATTWESWSRNKKAPYRSLQVAEAALQLLYDLSVGDETLAAEALRVSMAADWQSFHWHFQHQNNVGHDTHREGGKASSHGADNLRWLETHS